MNKLFTKIASLALGAAMAFGVGVAVASNSREATPVHAADEINYKTFDFETSTAHRTSGTNNYTTAKTYTHFVTDDTATSGGDCVNPSGSISGYNYMARMKSSHKSDTLTLGPISKTVSSTAYKTSKITYDIKGPTAVSVQPSYSTDGSTFTNIGSAQSFATSTTNKTATINASGVSMDDFYIRFTVSYSGSSTSNQDSRIDNIKLYGFAEAAAKTLSSIALSGSYPTSFTQGDAFSHSGMTVTATYDDTTTADVTSSATFSGYNMSNTGAQTVTVSYTESGTTKTTTYSITVNAPSKTLSSIAITTPPTKTSYEVGETFDSTGMVVTASFSDSSSSTVQGSCTFSPDGALSISDTEITVSYTYGGTTKTATQSITVTAPSSVTFTAGTDVGTATAAGQAGTITKDGISFYCSSIRNHDAPYRLYSGSTVTFTSTIGNMAKIEFSGSSSDKISNMGSATTGTLVTDSTNNKATWTGDASSVSFTMTAQGRADTIVVTLASTDPLVELAADSATSVSMMKGDSDTSVKVHVANIASKTWTYTFDEGEDEGLSTSSYINVSAGAAVDDVHTLTITTKAVGSTVLHIAVSGTACATTIPVTVAAKPAVGTLVAKLNSAVVSSAVECVTGSHVAFTFEAEDTDGNPYSVNAAALKLTITSGSSYGTAYGTTGINGVAQGTVVARFALKVLETVYVDVTVNVIDDYIETVGTPTFATGLTDTQGQSPTVSVFTARPGTMHSGSATTVPFENYKFAYTNSYAASEYGSVFSYDFSHGTTVDSTHKLQTIYVFCDIDEAAHGSFTVTVEQLDDPLTAITFTNVTNNKVDVTRGSTFQLEWAYTPTNPTDGKEVEFIIDDNDDGIDITVSELGLISIGASSDLGTALVLIQSTHDDTIQDYVYVSAVLGTMKYTVNETESWNLVDDVSTLASGDQVILTGVKSEVAYAAGLWAGGNNVPADTENTLTVSGSTVTGVVSTMIYTLEDGSVDGSVAFKGSDGKYLYAASSGSNYMKSQNSIDGNASFILNADGTVVAQGSNTRNYMRYNNSSTSNLFSCYGSTSTTGELVTFYKKSGGDVQMDVTETLFNGIHNNFGVGKTYEWDATCSEFDEDAWLDACIALTEITDYSSYKLNRAVGNIAGNEVEQFIAKYDIIIGKFGTTHDHLDRYAEGGINYGSIGISPMSILSESGSTVAIVVVVSMIGFSAVGGYFFLRKRKEI